jgi:hypothetical protein
MIAASWKALPLKPLQVDRITIQIMKSHWTTSGLCYRYQNKRTGAGRFVIQQYVGMRDSNGRGSNGLPVGIAGRVEGRGAHLVVQGDLQLGHVVAVFLHRLPGGTFQEGLF